MNLIQKGSSGQRKEFSGQGVEDGRRCVCNAEG